MAALPVNAKPRSRVERRDRGRVGLKVVLAGMMRSGLIGVAALLTLASPLYAGDGPTVRFGLSAQDFTSPEPGVNLRGEVIFAQPAFLKDHSLPALLMPAPVAGLSANLGHGTSFLYAGALWTFPITGPLFVEASISAAANNGVSEPGQGRAALGCRAGFREEAGIGWRFDADWSAILTVEHYSNANLCNHNRGLTNVGLMIGRSF